MQKKIILNWCVFVLFSTKLFAAQANISEEFEINSSYYELVNYLNEYSSEIREVVGLETIKKLKNKRYNVKIKSSKIPLSWIIYEECQEKGTEYHYVSKLDKRIEGAFLWSNKIVTIDQYAQKEDSFKAPPFEVTGKIKKYEIQMIVKKTNKCSMVQIKVNIEIENPEISNAILILDIKKRIQKLENHLKSILKN